jgi:hypothetical protein
MLAFGALFWCGDLYSNLNAAHEAPASVVIVSKAETTGVVAVPGMEIEMCIKHIYYRGPKLHLGH